MIKINLLGVERKVVAQRVVSDNPLRPMMLSAGLVLLLFAGLIGWRYRMLGAESDRLHDEIAVAQQETVRLQSVLAQVQQFEQRRIQLQQRVGLIEQLRSDQTGPVHMLDQISRALPSVVWLTTLKQAPAGNEVVIAGRSTTPTGLPDFVGNLEASGYFKKSIEIVSSTTEPLTIPPGDLVRFEIKAIFQQPGAPAPAAKTGN